MPETLDGYRYIGYVASRWRWMAMSAAVAVGLAAVLTLLQAPQYTATARILIDPPSGSDPRTSTAVSPIYLESLRTYESLASGDTLFNAAMDRFGLRQEFARRPVESVKKRVLKVGLVRNTRILEISVTLPDPHKAQAVAQYVAESAAGINRDLAAGNDRDLAQGAETEQDAARKRVDAADREWTKALVAEPVDELTAALAANAELKGKLEEQLLSAQADATSARERAKTAPASEQEQAHTEEAEALTRAGTLTKQIDALSRQLAGDEKALGQRRADRDRIAAEQKSAQAALSIIQGRVVQAKAEAGSRAERLRVIDPGIVPERPSSPNLPLNVAAALFLGFALPAVYFVIELSVSAGAARAARKRVREVTRSSHVAS